MALQAYSQEGNQRIELVRCDALDGGIFNNQNIIKLLGNVVFRQGDALMYCDSAYQYKSINKLEAFSNIRIEQGDTLKLFGDKLVYEGEKRKAVITGKVKLINQSTVLETNLLDYYLSTRVANYYTGGVITDKDTRLVSKSGRYEAFIATFYFKDQVVATDKDSKIETDTLIYQTGIRKAIFVGPTRIYDNDGVLYAEDGEYYLSTKVSNFRGRVSMESGSYFLSGDSVNYDQLNQLGWAKGNVKMISKSDQVTIYGREARYNKITGITKVYGDPWMENLVSGDTLFLSADSLISIDRKVEKFRILLAYYGVRVFKSDLQGISDSLVYRFTDSTIHFYRKPVLWTDDNQLSADSLHIQLANNKLDKMFMRFNSFIISIDTLGYFNQMAGRYMTSFFDSGRISRVEVRGNEESIYHALKEDTALMGLNKVVCSDMNILFKDNELQTITFLRQPDALFIPPKEIKEEETRLRGFDWKLSLRPDKEAVLYRGRTRKSLD
jgi:lipopolysaccharide export system protein LptA